MTALLASATILTAWVVVAAGLCGLGALARRWLGAAGGDVAADDLFWFGWATCLAFLQLWNFVLPVDGRAALALLVAGLAGLAVSPAARRAVGVVGRGIGTWEGGLLLLVAAWVANLALDGPHHGDSGLYHFASVRWAAEHAVVPGLGNLHSRLAFNSADFLWIAALGSGPFAGRGFHLANGVLLLAPLSRSLLAAVATCRGRPASAAVLFDALMLFPLIEKVWNLHYLTSPEPDLPVFVLGIVVASALARAVEATGPGAGRGADAAAVAIAASLAGVVIKLSFAGFAGAAVVVALAVEPRSGADRTSSLRATALASTLLLVPWLARGVILSGYPLYPFPGVSLPVEWALPRATAVGEYEWIRSWARAPGGPPGAVLGGWAWLGPWLRSILASPHALVTDVLPLLAGAVGATAIAARLVRTGRSVRPQLRALLVPLPAAAGMVYWFATAPALRFAGSASWVLGGGLVVTAAALVGRARLASLLAWGSIALAGTGLAHEVWQRGPLLVPAGPDAGFHPPPRVELVPRRTASGLEVLTPARGEACWDAPLPCTPYFSPRLRLRAPGRLGSGFVSGGGTSPAGGGGRA